MRQRVALDECESFGSADSVVADSGCCRGYGDCCRVKICGHKYIRQRLNVNLARTHRSNDDKMFAGIGRKLRIEVGGKVVDVRIGRLVDRV